MKPPAPRWGSTASLSQPEVQGGTEMPQVPSHVSHLPVILSRLPVHDSFCSPSSWAMFCSIIRLVFADSACCTATCQESPPNHPRPQTHRNGPGSDTPPLQSQRRGSQQPSALFFHPTVECDFRPLLQHAPAPRVTFLQLSQHV